MKTNLVEAGKEFAEWIKQLKIVTSDKLNISPSEVKVNEEAAYSYYSSGFTPTQCFRDAYQSDGD